MTTSRTISSLLACGLIACTGCGLYGIGAGTGTDFTAQLSGDAERPDPITTAATGTATFTLNTDETQLDYAIMASGLSGDVTAAHFHFSAAGAAGPGDVIFTISDSVENDGNGSATAQGSWNLTADDVSNLRIGYIYVNFHTEMNPAGEIRGNLVAAE